MYFFIVLRQVLTPTIRISVITAGIYHLSFAGIVLFHFPILSCFPTQRNNIYHRFYWMIFEINSHQPFSKCFFLSGSIDNTTITESIWSFIIINDLITVLNFRSFLLVFVIIIWKFFVIFFFSRMIWISMWHKIFFR